VGAAPEKLLAAVPLENASLSLSAVWGRFFRDGRRIFGHVLDPRTGQPVTAAVLAAVVSPSATETDALSTALLTLGSGGLDAITALRPGLQALVVEEQDGRAFTSARGIRLHAEAC
jgi:thiamine biosynthesis lipoprotein